MAGTTVRIKQKTRDTLRDLAARSGEPLQNILDHAVEAYRRQKFLHDANEAFERLRNNPQEWDQEQKEREEWDVTLTDGKD